MICMRDRSRRGVARERMAAVSVGGGGRNIGVAMDFSACSKAALRWAAASMARPGDRLVLVHVKASFQYEQGVAHLWEQQGSPMIPLVELADPRVSRIYGVAPDAETIGILTSAANQKGVEVVAKVYWGEPAKKLTEAAQGIPLHWLVVGNRGLGAVKRVLMGSVSTYVANHATCPVTVVRENLPPPPPPPQPPQPVATAASYY
ncbi:universal stress protein PHOS32-like [Oryza glaberrima]|uniref:universal stress protein PHOS32-like n=1 Tax=Oryza glaberrima TaxID=4538 RepID=UPI00224C5066|nr:universal stress protein PHOS32-like [Oryza glaberrima]